MDEDMATAIVDTLVRLGYKNVECVNGTVWYEDENENLYRLTPQVVG